MRQRHPVAGIGVSGLRSSAGEARRFPLGHLVSDLLLGRVHVGGGHARGNQGELRLELLVGELGAAQAVDAQCEVVRVFPEALRPALGLAVAEPQRRFLADPQQDRQRSIDLLLAGDVPAAGRLQAPHVRQQADAVGQLGQQRLELKAEGQPLHPERTRIHIGGGPVIERRGVPGPARPAAGQHRLTDVLVLVQRQQEPHLQLRLELDEVPHEDVLVVHVAVVEDRRELDLPALHPDQDVPAVQVPVGPSHQRLGQALPRQRPVDVVARVQVPDLLLGGGDVLAVLQPDQVAAQLDAPGLRGPPGEGLSQPLPVETARQGGVGPRAAVEPPGEVPVDLADHPLHGDGVGLVVVDRPEDRRFQALRALRERVGAEEGIGVLVDDGHPPGRQVLLCDGDEDPAGEVVVQDAPSPPQVVILDGVPGAELDHVGAVGVL